MGARLPLLSFALRGGRCALAGGLLALSGAAVAAPNLLVVVVDDVGADKIGAYAAEIEGYRLTADHLPSTPTFDSLAASGLRFASAWANPLCSPTRAGILTGRHAFRTGVGAPEVQSVELDLNEEITLADALTGPSAPEPYTAAYFGKWHLGSSNAGGEVDWSLDEDEGGYAERAVTAPPLQGGFEAFAGWYAGTVPDYFLWTRMYADAPEQTALETMSEYALETTVTDTLHWIDQQSGPWFAFVGLFGAHLRAGARQYDSEDVSESCHEVACLRDGTCTDENRAAYQALVECTDHAIGELLQGMDPATLAETLVVVTADNGSEETVLEGPFAFTGEREGNGKGTTYESGVHVPLVIAHGASWLAWSECSEADRDAGACALPEDLIVAPGRAVASPVHTTDLFATLTSVGGARQTTGIDSVNLSRCFTNPSPTCVGRPRAVYTETFERGADGGLRNSWAALRRGDYKLVAWWDTSARCLQRELYRLDVDPFERDDVASRAPGITESLQDALDAQGVEWLATATRCF